LGRLDIIAGLLMAAIPFIALEAIGIVVKFDLIAADLGFVTGLVLARSWRH
jgi:hypothetical protein